MIHLSNLKDLNNLDYQSILSSLHTICSEYDPKTTVKNFITDKIHSSNSTSYGFVDNGVVKSFIVLETLQPHYGTVYTYSESDNDYVNLISQFLTTHQLSNFVFELIHFRKDHLVNDIFINFGLLEKPRQRMLYSINDDLTPVQYPSHLKFEPISINNLNHLASISTAAHRIRHAVEGYHDFFNSDDRIKMEKCLLDELFNPYAHKSSFLMKCHKDYIGVCSAVIMDGWNSEKIIWIMDFSLLPKYQGFGYAKYFLNYIVEQTQLSGFSQLGLGVTISNKTAVRLYESFGFQVKEYFVEFICR